MVFRVFSGIIGLVFFIFLVLLTFFSGGNGEIQNFSVEKTSTGLFSISGSGNLTNISDLSEIDGIFSFERITDLDSIYFRSGSDYTRTQVGEANTIELGRGEFIIDIQSLENQYIVTHSFFNVEILGSGKIYINTQDTKNYSLVSFNTISKVDLKDGKDFVTELYLYPHMYLRFNPLRSRFLKNADLVRISSVFTLASLGPSLAIASTTLDLAGKLGIEKQDFLDEYIKFSKNQSEQNNKKLSEIYAINSWEFPGVGYLKKYFYLFLNDAKKKAYYKNSAFKKITTLVNSDKREPMLIQSIIDDLETLSTYDQDYDDIISIIDYYYKLTLLDSDFLKINSKINFHSLILAIKGESDNKDRESYLALNSLYDTYDLYEKYSYENLISFVREYIETNKILDGDLSLIKKEELDYFSLFLSKIFISKFSSDDESLQEFTRENNLRYILEVMESYISIDNIIYDSTGDRRATTGIYVHLDILEKLEDFVRNGLFRTERGVNGVLEKSTKFSINSREISLLEKNIKDLLDFYDDNKKFLSEENQTDISLINDYTSLQSKFIEYFLALTDYDNYIYSYDEAKANLFNIKTFGEKDNNIVLSKDNALNYIKQFSNTSLNDLSIAITEDYYQIKDLIIDGKNFSFYLHPSDNNRVDSIVINNKPITFSYKLDMVELDWYEKFQNAKDAEEKDKYNFSNFFLNTFSGGNDSNPVEIFEIGNNGNGSQDKFIVVFKRDKLLSESGEFSEVASFLKIDFSDIDVVARGDLYDIFITEADLNVSLAKGEFSADFASDYVLEKDKHYFKNIRLYPYKSNLGVRKPLLQDNFIQIVGNINLIDLEGELKELGEAYNNLQSVYNAVEKKLDVSEITVRYIKSSKKVNFRFDYRGDFISILLSGDTIASISRSGEILVRDVNYRTIDDILNTIKK